jgi:hypothetical protein
MIKVIGADGTVYVQAWEVTVQGRSLGYVYDQLEALTKFDANVGANMSTLVIVRHVDNSREYLYGAIAERVRNYRDETGSMLV